MRSANQSTAQPNLEFFKISHNMWKYVGGAVFVGSLLYGIKKYCAGGVCRCISRLDGLVIIITGANSGIGKALASELAHRGATLVLACRDVEKANAIKEVLVEKNNNIQVYVRELDLNSFESIVRFSEYINSEFKEVYALVNNAGVFYHPQQLTGNNFDVTLQTNYLGPFVLTHYLLKALKKSEHARIVNVTSEAHRIANAYDLKAITLCQKEFRCHFKAYGASKLALILFTNVLSKKLAGTTNIIVNAVNPGNVETDIYRHYPPLSNSWSFASQWFLRILIVKRPHQGAQTVLHALLTSNRSTGQYLSDCQLALPSSLALNNELAEEYYNLTLEVLADQFNTESDC